MLAFSGMISMLELGRMSRYAEGLLRSGSANMSLSKQMLDAAQEENTAVLQMIILDDETYHDTFRRARDRFAGALLEAENGGYVGAGIDAVRTAWDNYDGIARRFASSSSLDDVRLFLDTYSGSYLALTSAVKEMISNSQRSLAEDAIQIKSRAYRAITPGIISLGVAIVMLLMFAFLIDHYYTRPALGITRGLRNYIDHKTPFNVKLEGHDEIRTLRDSVEELISMYRNKKS